MSSSTIITIGRQYGSGGHKIGEFLANRLQLPYYDDELMVIAAGVDALLEQDSRENQTRQTSQGDQDSREDWESRENQDHYAVSDPLFYTAGTGISFDLYRKVIRQLAGKGDAVMIGRCADEILRQEGSKVLSVFVAAPLDHRIARTVRCEGISEEEVANQIRKKDAARKSFYEYHTGKTWGDPSSYDLYYDTSETDIGSIIVDIIQHYRALKNT